MPHDKVGPKETQQRALREARIAENKAKIDNTAVKKVKAIGRVTNVKAKRGGGRGR